MGINWSRGNMGFTMYIYIPFAQRWPGGLGGGLEALRDWPNEGVDAKVRKLVRFFERDCPEVLENDPYTLESYTICKAYLANESIGDAVKNEAITMKSRPDRDWSKGEMCFTEDIYVPFVLGWHAELYRALEALETWPDEATDDKIRKLVTFFERDCPEVLENEDDTRESYKLCRAHLALMAMRPVYYPMRWVRGKIDGQGTE